MMRREFIALLGGAAAWPLAARAQQSAMPVIGFLRTQIARDNRGPSARIPPGPKETGFLEGENVAIEYRWAEGQFERLPELASELVRRQVGVIAATNTASALAATAATKTIPIVFAVPEDPVGLGLVANIARPSGNATGINFFSQEVVTKRLELLRELVPVANRVAVLLNPAAAATTRTTVREVAGAARDLGLQIQFFNANTSVEINAAFASFGRERPDALFVGGDAFFQVRRAQVVNLGVAPRGPGDIWRARICLSRRANELRKQPYGCLSSNRRLCGPHSQGRQAKRLAGGAGVQIRVGHQRRDRPDAGTQHPAFAPRPRRRGDRVMKRREFITLLGGAAAAWPVVARAQQGGTMRRVGVLMNSGMDDEQGKARLAAFLQGLQQLGWTEGRNVHVDVRWGTVADPVITRQQAAELLALSPEIILTATTLPAAELRRATRSVPIVFAMVVDPVGAGIVESLPRPGGNITGFMQFEFSLAGKWLGLLKQIAPGVTRAAHSARPQHRDRDRPVRCHPGHGTAARHGCHPCRCA